MFAVDHLRSRCARGVVWGLEPEELMMETLHSFQVVLAHDGALQIILDQEWPEDEAVLADEVARDGFDYSECIEAVRRDQARTIETLLARWKREAAAARAQAAGRLAARALVKIRQDSI
jgi:hypothetical protein